MNVEKRIQNLIEEKYGNEKKFAEEAGIPYTTLRSVFERTFMKSRFQNVLKICRALDISVDGVANNEVLFISENDLSDTLTGNKKYSLLSDFGKKAVLSTIDHEYEREHADAPEVTVTQDKKTGKNIYDS